MKKAGEFAVTEKQAVLLREAYRRWKMYSRGDDKTILEAWTGLGSATFYKPVVDAGFMEPIHALHPGNSIWWRLTEKGVLAMTMLGWIEGGLYEGETWRKTGRYSSR